MLDERRLIIEELDDKAKQVSSDHYVFWDTRVINFRWLCFLTEVAQRVMDKCISVSSPGDYKDSDFWIEFYYEFIEDSFSLWRKPEYTHPEQMDMGKKIMEQF